MRNIFLILMLLGSFVFSSQMSAQAVILKTDTVMIDCKSSDTFLIPIRVRNFTNVGSMQFTVSWNANDLDYAYTTQLNPLLTQGAFNAGFDSTTYLASGRITFTYTKFGGVSVPNDSVIFSLAFRRISGPFSPVQITGNPVQIEITDASGNELTVQTVTGGVQPIDDTPPTIVCPDNLTMSVNSPSAVNDIGPLSAIDNCSIPEVGWTSSGATIASAPNDPDASGAIFNFGTSTVTYTATDVGNNTATCSFTITLDISNTSDVLTLIAQSGSAACGQTYSLDVTALNFDSLGSLQFSLGWNPAFLQYVSVNNFNPALQLAATNFGISSVGTGFIAFSWTTNSLSGTTIPDNAVLFTLNFNVAGGNNGNSPITFGDFPSVREAYTSAVFPPEEIQATYINGQVSFQDLEAPTITCPANITATAEVGNTSAAVTGTGPVSYSDNCNNPTISYTQTGATTGQGTLNADGNYNVGLTTVTYTATDASGNTGTCAFNVLVNSAAGLGLAVDTVYADCQNNGGPIAFNVTVQDFSDLIGLQFSLGWDPTVLEFDTVGNGYPGLNLDAADYLNFIGTDMGILRFLSGNPVAPFWPSIPDGGIMFTVYFNVINPNGTTNIDFVPPFDAVNTAFNSVPFNTTSGYFTISDQSPPTLTCPDNVEVDAAEGTCSETIILPLPDAQDACGQIQEIISSKADSLFNAGATTVFFTAYDQAGNSASCSVIVTVTEQLPPQINGCPSNIIVVAPADTCTIPIYWDIPEAVDSCGQGGVSLSGDFAPGDPFSIGVTTVTYVASDASGNTALCVFTIEIQDTLAPVVTCPEDMIVAPDEGLCTATVNLTAPLAGDNCDDAPELIGFEPTVVLDAGTSLVTYVVVDDFGNTGSCSFNITVIDNNAPVFDGCPADLTLDTEPDTCGAFPTWTAPVATDDCDLDGVDIFSDIEPGTFFPTGTTTVTYSAVDNAGNVTTCSFNVTVSENIPPVITGCPDNIMIELPSDKCDSLVTWDPPTAEDNCGAVTIISDLDPGVFPAGTTTVTYTVLDDAGNSSICTFNVVLIDLVPPVFTSCPQDVTVSTESPCGFAVEWIFPTATDNCSVPQFESSFMPGDTFSVGTTTLVIRAFDASNNYDTCTFTITVNGPFKRFEQIPLNIDLAGCDSVATWTPPIAVGFCDLDTLYSNYQPGDTFPIGVTTVQYTAVDNDGFSTTATFTVTVTAGLPPLITCPTSEIVVDAAGGIYTNPGDFISSATAGPNCSAAILNFGTPTAIDDCGIPTVQQIDGLLTGASFPVGRDTLVFTATDGSGSSAQCSVIIEVLPIRPLDPTADPNPGCAGDMVVLTVPTIAGATYSWTGPQGFTASTSQVTIQQLTPANAGNYIVTANINGCITPADTVLVQLAIQPNAVDDTGFSIDPNTLDTFNILLNDVLIPAGDFVITEVSPLNGVTNLGNGLFSYQAGPDPGSASFFYEVCSQSCPLLCDMATVTIRIDDIGCTFIPNIFTPNGDEVNDWLVIKCLDSGFFNENSLVVYNQWGDKVYEASPYSNDPDKAWRGTLDGEAGKDLPDGVYFYVFKPGPNEATAKGFIEIFR
ncbi:MAG TPA: HYR domain-containing protein [Saprospiraceae bacterium]|nr:HYR domain-containing protein [Saprospiraceae bacterium]